ncbi:hypothetical protein [Microbacterium sp. PAMC21962]|uniref:hypothetical protein n=1 Tax=Microbacterium sp. PAMC21962 TaxID=2861280 RepID=UPI001C6289D6|nr:hypothetical protein [Microbacterium sp. PAMC21962]QYF98938.1 hypothetical protein KY498_06910 [Microbacterium sp. PAMC21962]
MIAAALAAVLLVAPMGGSDAPTPYTVDAAGITLPAGASFTDGGHVNIRTTTGSYSIHFEALNNQPSGKWIGASFLPWSAFGLDAASVCVEWVQLAEFPEHFGEGGQAPVGAGCSVTPEPSPSPTLTSQPSPSPSQTVAASPTPAPSEVVTPITTSTLHPQIVSTEGAGPTRLAESGAQLFPFAAGVALIAAGVAFIRIRKASRR